MTYILTPEQRALRSLDYYIDKDTPRAETSITQDVGTEEDIPDRLNAMEMVSSAFVIPPKRLD